MPRSSDDDAGGFSIPLGLIVIGGIALFGALTVFGGWFTVDQGERGVVTRFGALHDIADPGLHLKMPWVDGVTDISVRVNDSTWEGKQALGSYSRDQQPAEIAAKVTWHIKSDNESVKDVYSRYRDEEGIDLAVVRPRAQEAIKTVFGHFNAVSVIQERARFNKEAEDAVRASIGDEPVVIDGVQVYNIDFSDAYEHAVEQRMQAEVEVAKVSQNLERERKEAEIKVVKARAEAESVTLRGVAEASAIKARSDALKDSPKLVDLTIAERWDGKLPQTMVPSAGVPLLQLSK